MRLALGGADTQASGDAGIRRQEGHVPESKQGQIVRPLRHRHAKQLNMLHATRDMSDRFPLCRYRSIDEERCTTRLWPWYAFSACWQKAAPPGTITLLPPYHASRIEDCAISRKTPPLHVEHDFQCESLVADDQHSFCVIPAPLTRAFVTDQTTSIIGVTEWR